ncbi:hypothetical protein DNTS_018622, partial [Danionella cerebrum]
REQLIALRTAAYRCSVPQGQTPNTPGTGSEDPPWVQCQEETLGKEETLQTGSPHRHYGKRAKMEFKRLTSLLLLICSSSTVFAASNVTEEVCDRRCLANIMVKKELFSAPQDDNCSIEVNITSIQYETLSFDTKDMQMTSRLKVNLEWIDPDLGWTIEKYRFPTIVLPVDKIWTPQIVLDNAVDTNVVPYSDDVQVRRDGVVNHAVILFTTVGCEINLFNYPFVMGSCPVAINGWTQKGCTMKLQISDNVSMVGASRGEWQTMDVKKIVDSSERVYLEVFLSINPFSAVVTLILPSGLLLLTDLFSFAMPFEGGERNTFKVTLVLSFTMFLIILNDHLPNGGSCSPLLHYHFSFCLVCLVISMLTSIVLTRLSVDDISLKCGSTAKVHPSEEDHHTVDSEKGSGVISTASGDLTAEGSALSKIVNFLEKLYNEEMEEETKKAFAYRLDKFCFRFFLSIYILYVIVVVSISRTDICKVDNLDFWDMSSNGDNSFDYSGVDNLETFQIP